LTAFQSKISIFNIGKIVKKLKPNSRSGLPACRSSLPKITINLHQNREIMFFVFHMQAIFGLISLFLSFNSIPTTGFESLTSLMKKLADSLFFADEDERDMSRFHPKGQKM
jgi:hypothetical protein